MYPNKPINYLNKFIKARRVAVIAVVLCCISIVMTIGYAKTSDEAMRVARSYQESAWSVSDQCDSLHRVIDDMENEKFFSENLKNE